MSYYWGMWGYWWIFWIILWILFFAFLIPVPRRRWSNYREIETPLQILQRRYAAGEITHEEYEERRARLLRDANQR